MLTALSFLFITVDIRDRITGSHYYKYCEWIPSLSLSPYSHTGIIFSGYNMLKKFGRPIRSGLIPVFNHCIAQSFIHSTNNYRSTQKNGSDYACPCSERA